MSQQMKGILGRVTDDDGTGYTVRLVADKRSPTTWEGRLEFVSDDERTLRTDVETTQPSVADLESWAYSLSSAHLDGALARAKKPVRRTPSGVHPSSAPSTPLDPLLRKLHLVEIETYVLRFFGAQRKMRIPTEEIFSQQQYANADLVRAFEALEKTHRLLIRATVDGIDWLYLTAEGARSLGIPAQPAGEIDREPPPALP